MFVCLFVYFCNIFYVLIYHPKLESAFFQLLQHLGHMRFCENLLRIQWNTWVSTETLLFGKSWTLNSSHQRSRNIFLESVTSTLVHSILACLADTPVKSLLDSPITSITSCFLVQFPRIKMDSYLEDFAAIPMRDLSSAALACDISKPLTFGASQPHTSCDDWILVLRWALSLSGLFLP